MISKPPHISKDIGLILLPPILFASEDQVHKEKTRCWMKTSPSVVKLKSRIGTMQCMKEEALNEHLFCCNAKPVETKFQSLQKLKSLIGTIHEVSVLNETSVVMQTL